jgi:hypothetical protein
MLQNASINNENVHEANKHESSQGDQRLSSQNVSHSHSEEMKNDNFEKISKGDIFAEIDANYNGESGIINLMDLKSFQ